MTPPRVVAVSLLALAAAAVTLGAAVAIARHAAEPEVATRIRLQLEPLPDETRRVWLESDAAGRGWLLLVREDGTTERLTPDAFVARLERDSRRREWLYRILNITSPVGVLWVLLGLTGQVLFTGRMVLQWLVSEHRRRSVVPVGFWWMSLGGASMLLVYFVWRRDIVGVLGQSTGWIIYVRNLLLIHQRPSGDGER